MSLKWSSSYVHSTQLWTAASFIYVGKALKVSKNISILAQKTFYSGLEKQQKITALQQRLASASRRIDVLFPTCTVSDSALRCPRGARQNIWSSSDRS